MSAMARELAEAARLTLDAARAHSLKLATAESCTGGLVSAALTEIAGSSDVFDRGFTTYSNAAKRDLLGVPEDRLDRHGAVSAETARAMAEGALARSCAQRAVSITGIAGPGGGSPEKPVGLVWFALARTGGETQVLARRFGEAGRGRVRLLSALEALRLLRSGL